MRTVLRAQPECQVVAFLIREGLQEESLEGTIVSDDGIGIGASGSGFGDGDRISAH
ncbi:hypothetical protein [Rhizobium giardinii]|uniref:hypothetical protein n=1 Tax=Rhizobium giardinii TaxID=56731 RepID=UPI0039DF9894